MLLISAGGETVSFSASHPSGFSHSVKFFRRYPFSKKQILSLNIIPQGQASRNRSQFSLLRYICNPSNFYSRLHI